VFVLSPRRRAQLGLAAAFAVLALSASTLLLVPRYSRPIAAADVGTVAPDFRLNDTDGRPVALSSYRGQAVVLFFGSLHSPQTADYNDRIDELARRYAADSRVKFLAVDVPTADDAATAPEDAALDRLRVRVDANIVGRPFPTLVDDHASIATRYSARDMPLFVVIDPKGVVAYRGSFDNSQDVAFATKPFLSNALADVLGAPSSAVAQMAR
jgi:cytochrome oxidase Cu insertion factor (SCO1/SenC/PrrC family)